jgi:hypothetical protein
LSRTSTSSLPARSRSNPASNMDTSAMHHHPTSSPHRADGSYSAPFARAFPQVRAWRRRIDRPTNLSKPGYSVWVAPRPWGRVLRGCDLALNHRSSRPRIDYTACRHRVRTQGTPRTEAFSRASPIPRRLLPVRRLLANPALPAAVVGESEVVRSSSDRSCRMLGGGGVQGELHLSPNRGPPIATSRQPALAQAIARFRAFASCVRQQ